MLTLVVDMTAKEDKAEEFESLMKGLAEKVLANESGCKMYQLARSKTEADGYVLIERYEDQEALAVHSNTDYFKAGMPTMMACLDGPPAIKMFDEVD